MTELIPNFTQIPNVIFDYWWSKLTPAEVKVVGILCRKTYGWHKTSDYISLTQLEKRTGMTKKTVIKAIDGLLAHGLLEKSQYSDEYGNHTNEYRLNVETPQDELYQKKPRPPGDFSGKKGKFGEGSVKNTPGVVENLHYPPGVKFTPTKETPRTKEILNKTHTVGGEIFPCGENENCLLTQAEKEKLLEKMDPKELQYWIEEVNIAVGRAGSHENFNKQYKLKAATHFYLILAWKRKRAAEGKPAGSQTGGPEANRKHAEQVRDNWQTMFTRKGITCNVREKYIEFYYPSHPNLEAMTVDFGARNFEQRVEDILRHKLKVMK